LKTSVVSARCSSYEPNDVDSALERALSHFDLASIIKPGSKVFIKINHLGHHPIESAVNTHPNVAYAVAKLISRFTPDITVGDGLEKPGHEHFQLSGYLDAFRDSPFELANLMGRRYVEAKVKNPLILKSVAFASAAIETDVLITVPKMKAHMLSFMTGAVKNHYGFLPLKLRKNLHKEYADLEEFCKALVDIYSIKIPQLVIMDAVVALEGYGPSRGGRPRRVDAIIAGTDAVAVDVVASHMMDFDPMDIDTTRFASQARLGVSEVCEIKHIREEGVPEIVSGFAHPVSSMLIKRVIERSPSFIRGALGWLLQNLKEVPVVVKAKCIGCGKCALHCPMQAIEIIDRCAAIEAKNCIHCFCCQEFCESDAISLRHNLIGKVIVGMARSFAAVKRLVRRGKDNRK